MQMNSESILESSESLQAEALKKIVAIKSSWILGNQLCAAL